MQVGCHVSISGSIDKSVDNAVERECSAFQIFTRNPRGWHAKPLTKEDITNFKTKLKESKIDRFATCAHMPYLPNLATPKEDGFEKHAEWKVSIVNNVTYHISLYGKLKGKANTENKYDFPPPADNLLFFGNCILTNKVDGEYETSSISPTSLK